jgi:16S rRNA (adenine1518-N6/adenine1519-N6)-dimethyltransferase
MARSRRRRYGQNFLVDKGIARRIVDLLDTDPPRVLEIGPGRGALTEPLLERFDRVLAFELDENLVAPLVDGFAHRGLEVQLADAVTADLDEFLGSGAPWQVASNLPYSVGSAIVRRLMPRCDLFSRVVVMLQREVAERLVAEPGDGNHGLMALERAVWADASLAFTVRPKAFRPVPKVTSAVVVLEPRPPAADEGQIARALAIAAGALTKPRKMLSNALGSGFTREMIERAGLDPDIRPGTVNLDSWLRLAATAAADHTPPK